MQTSLGFISSYFHFSLRGRIKAWPGASSRCSILLLLQLVLLGSVGIGAQQAPVVAQWQGLLRNAAHAPIAGATIRLNSGANTADSVTGNDGRFSMQAVPIG